MLFSEKEKLWVECEWGVRGLRVLNAPVIITIIIKLSVAVNFECFQRQKACAVAAIIPSLHKQAHDGMFAFSLQNTQSMNPSPQHSQSEREFIFPMDILRGCIFSCLSDCLSRSMKSCIRSLSVVRLDI